MQGKMNDWIRKFMCNKLKYVNIWRLPDRSTFPKEGIRYYYSFSAANDLHFKVGYGDIMVCDYATSQNAIDVCF